MRTGNRGQVVVLFVLALLVLLGFAALGIDVGYLYSVKTELQRSADAGALGGAYVFNDGDWSFGSTPPEPMRTKAVQRAQDAATSDPVGASPVSAGAVNVTFPAVNPNQIQVTIQKNVNLFFAGIVGMPSVTVSATATAEAVRVEQNVECLKPLAVPLPYVDRDNNERWNSGDGSPTDPRQGTHVTDLRIVDATISSSFDVRNNSGRLFALDLCQNGIVDSTTYQNWIADPSQDLSVIQCTRTCPGGSAFVGTRNGRIWVRRSQSPGATMTGLQRLINSDRGARFNYDSGNYPNLPGSNLHNGPAWITSPRVMRVALYDPSVAAGPSQADRRILVWGFAGFWIEGVRSHSCDCHWVGFGPFRRWVCSTCSYVDGYFVPDSAVGVESAGPRLIEPSLKMTRLVQ